MTNKITQKRTHVVLPAPLVAQVDAIVGKRGRSRFLAEAAAKELKRLRLLSALRRAAGAWKTSEHPELKDGAAAWVGSLRQQSSDRFRRISPKR